MPAKRGFARGTMGSLGSRTLQHRNPDASEDEQRRIFMSESPILEAFRQRHS